MAVFPFLLLWDERSTLPFSPVLPGLLVLVVVLALGPSMLYAIVRRRGDGTGTRFAGLGRASLVISWVWFAGWWAFGA